jgi:hypothetical protein
MATTSLPALSWLELFDGSHNYGHDDALLDNMYEIPF